MSDHVSLDFLFTILTAATGIVWYQEFTDGDPNATATTWYREVAEEDTGGGVVNIPVVVRRFRTNGAVITDLPAGTHALSAQFVRKHKYFRAQMAFVAGGGTVSSMQVFAEFGAVANSPVIS